MRNAFVFTCEECGRDNFVPVYTRVMSDDEIELFRQQIEANDAYAGMKIIISPEQTVRPSHVKCNHCHTDFKARYPAFDQFKD